MMSNSIEHSLADSYDSMNDLLKEMAAKDIKPIHTLDLINGLLCRFDIQGDKTGSKCGWVVKHKNSDGSVVAVYGSWKTGLQYTYNSNFSSGVISSEVREAIKQAKEMAKQAKERLLDLGTASCIRLWSLSTPAALDHPYLKQKSIQPHLARVTDSGLLVIPIRDINGTLISLQYISSSFGKRFSRNTKVQGGFCPFGLAADGNTILIAEGFATAATLYELIGLPVVAALSAGNLLPVAVAVKGKYPDKSLIICADNDAGSDKNPGLTKAEEAAKAIKAEVIYPTFDDGEDGTDFNDFATSHGRDAAKAMIMGGIN